MGIGFVNATAPTLQNITDLTNVSSVPELFININHIVYGGWFWFIMLWTLWIILFFAANQRDNQILQNAMYSGTVITFLSLFLRAIEVSHSGFPQGLLSDYQMWVFPLLTILIAMILWMSRQK